MHKSISDATVKRLFRYYQYLWALSKKGEVRVSSSSLAKALGLTASQIRQDLSSFGCFGQQGYGYNILQLMEEMARIAGLGAHRRTILIGVGSLGRAVANHLNFDELGFHLIALFDKKESLTGQIVRGLPVRHTSGLDDYCRENLPKAAVLCLPAAVAPSVARQLCHLGITGIWNLSSCELPELPGVVVENLNLNDSLMGLSYRLSEI